MPTTDSPSWWADVQQDRLDLVDDRVTADWLEEDVEFVPRRRFPRRDEGIGDNHRLHGVFIHAESAPQARHTVADAAVAATDELRAGAPAEGAGASARASTPGRRTVQITGRPSEASSLAAARPRRPRTASDRVGHRPDRIALWAVLLGVILIIIAIMSSDSQAATHAAALTAPLA